MNPFEALILMVAKAAELAIIEALIMDLRAVAEDEEFVKACVEDLPCLRKWILIEYAVIALNEE